MRDKVPCMYCSRPSDSREHVIATRFIDVLREDPRGLSMPPVLRVAVPGATREIGGRRLPGGRRTLELTAPICSRCNSGWMNAVDEVAYPYVAEMIRGKCVTLNRAAAEAVATWACKLAITSRGNPHGPLPVAPAWAAWLREHRSPVPYWRVWLGFHDGREPFGYYPHNVSIEALERDAHGLRPSGRVTHNNGVLATFVVGYLVAQIFGFDTPVNVETRDQMGMLPRLWPPVSEFHWPPPEAVIDETLPAVTRRLISPRQSPRP